MSLRERSAMSLDEAIRRRRSVRGYRPDEVPEAMLREVFELAQWAPSNCNVQPWTPHVVSGEALRRLRDALVGAAVRDEPIRPDWPADSKFTDVYRERQVDAAQRLYGAMGVERRDLVARKMAIFAITRSSTPRTPSSFSWPTPSTRARRPISGCMRKPSCLR
jgi:nitroreductase